jgi:lipid A 3-O-deacylase
MSRNSGWWFSIFFAVTCASAAGADSDKYGLDADKKNDFSDHFQRGRYELSLMSGAMFSPIGADQHRPTEDYTLSGLQFGWMLTSAKGTGWTRGSWEVALEAMGGSVFKGGGSYVAGGTVWLRYNFVPANWRVMPYVQAGAGAEATDMDQRLIGQTFNFNLDLAVGVRCFVARNWAIDLECRYQHLSNGTIAKHDVGVNAVGPMVGVSFCF